MLIGTRRHWVYLVILAAILPMATRGANCGHNIGYFCSKSEIYDYCRSKNWVVGVIGSPGSIDDLIKRIPDRKTSANFWALVYYLGPYKKLSRFEEVARIVTVHKNGKFSLHPTAGKAAVWCQKQELRKRWPQYYKTLESACEAFTHKTQEELDECYQDLTHWSGLKWLQKIETYGNWALDDFKEACRDHTHEYSGRYARQGQEILYWRLRTPCKEKGFKKEPAGFCTKKCVRP